MVERSVCDIMAVSLVDLKEIFLDELKADWLVVLKAARSAYFLADVMVALKVVSKAYG
jgi:hypothetical protein